MITEAPSSGKYWIAEQENLQSRRQEMSRRWNDPPAWPAEPQNHHRQAFERDVSGGVAHE